MAEPPERERGLCPLQLLDGHVPQRWLDGVADAEARRLDELMADRNLLSRLMWDGYDGPDYDRFAERLARYGYAVMHAWCASELIFARCADKGWKVRRARIGPDDADELAAETVAVALVKFRETVLVPGLWDPAKGASLNTYFVGQCLLRFANVYRRWFRETRPMALAVDPDSDPCFERLDRDLSVAPEYRTLLRAEANDAMQGIADELTRAIVAFKAADRTNEEIAELCQISVAVVKSRLYRLQHRKDRGDAA
jgi:DNA-directed RNA polymerase specialized sigma24 family protein